MSEAEARRQAKQEAERRQAEARAAREALFEELVAFASETGFLRAKRHDQGVSLRWQDKHLHFEAEGDADRVKITFEGMGDAQHALYREAQLDDRWIWVAARGRREDRRPLYDQGLEELLVRALGLPRPTDGDDGEPQGGGGDPVSRRL